MRSLIRGAPDAGSLRLAARVREPRDGLIYGIPWGLAVWLLESTAFALTRDSLSGAWPMLLALAFMWITRGVALASAANWLATCMRPALAWATFPLLAAMLSLAWDGTDATAQLSHRLFRTDLPRSGQFLFTLWPMLVYGAPLFAFCLLDVRFRRARALLAQAEAARMQYAMAIDTVRFELLSRRVDPGKLLTLLQDVRRSVASGEARASARLDALVELLRGAMPAVRRESLVPAAATEDFQQGGYDEHGSGE